MHGVLGGQVRFNIRLRQVGAQATPPLCSAQLWYTFPSGHSPTSPLSASATCMHTVPQNETRSCPNLSASVRQSWETSYKGTRLSTMARGRQPETVLCCWKEQELKGGGEQGGYGTFIFWHTLHLPISAQAEGQIMKRGRRRRVSMKLAAITRLDKVLSVSTALELYLPSQTGHPV